MRKLVAPGVTAGAIAGEAPGKINGRFALNTRWEISQGRSDKKIKWTGQRPVCFEKGQVKPYLVGF